MSKVIDSSTYFEIQQVLFEVYNFDTVIDSK